MAVGAATMHVGAISTVVGLWFDEKRPLAISLALNGASSGGILITPPLVLAIAHYGFSHAMLGASCVMAVVLLPAIALWIGRPAAVAAARRHAARAAPHGRGGSALRSTKFWSVAAPFALALTAQVGFLVHQIAILEPTLGRAQAGFSVAALTVTAITGRFAFGAFAARLDMRRFAAWSMASQAAALLALTATGNPAALIAACVLFGLSAGNLMTLPAADHPARIRGGLVRRADRAVVGDQPVHLCVRPGRARRRARRDRRLHRAADDLRRARSRRRGVDPAARQ